jgi:adenylate kinase family enzyme
VTAIVSAEGWVIDGNYSAIQPLVWERADTVIWLDPPRWTVMRRIIWWTIRRAAGRTELWNGNRERWHNLFTWDEQESVISWAWHHYPIYRQRYAAAARDPRYAHLVLRRIATCADPHQLIHSAR